tara:strand:- start:268 stop:432 length:165 start_codon:yes stop_codon:yes gene_type:complete
MEEVIVEGLDYNDFVSLKEILSNHANFNSQQHELYADNLILIEKIDKIIRVFEE